LIGLLIASLTSINSYSKDSVSIEKGTPAPFKGILFTSQKAQQIRIELIERDQFKLFNKTLLENTEIQKTIILNQKEQVSILLNQNDKLVSIAEKAQARSNLARVTWFGLGVLTTGLAVYGASLLVR
jgi:protein-arginine kinase